MIKTFGLGLAIVLSPCTYFLLPLVFALATGVSTKASKTSYISRIINFIAGFIIGATSIYFLASLLKALTVFNFIKLILGILFVSLGIYSMYKPLSANLPIYNTKNLFLTGFLVPIISSLSGCGLPIIASLSTISVKNILAITFFVLGMLIPYLLVFLTGHFATNIFKKFLSKTHVLWHKLTSILFLFLGFYTLLSVGFFNEQDLTIVLVLIIIIFAILCYKVCGLNNKKRFAKYLLATISFMLWSISITACKNFTNTTGPLETSRLLGNFVNYSPHTCLDGISFCPYCMTCSVIFLVTAILTTYAYLSVTTEQSNIKHAKQRV